MAELKIPIDLIWGEKDPWEPLEEAKRWDLTIKCIKSIHTIPNAGHCPHDEASKEVNNILKEILQRSSRSKCPSFLDIE